MLILDGKSAHKPTEKLLSNLQALSKLFALPQMLVRDDGEFLVDLSQGQTPEQLVFWLVPVIVKDSSIVQRLPLSVICELVLANIPNAQMLYPRLRQSIASGSHDVLAFFMERLCIESASDRLAAIYALSSSCSENAPAVSALTITQYFKELYFILFFVFHRT